MTTPIDSVDLTPFGFTQTESAAYGALLEMGPSSGYAIGGALSIARANAYQALRGLVAKGAAVAGGEDPTVYRPVRPDALLAKISRDEAAKLEELERQIDAYSAAPGAPDTHRFSGERELAAIALRSVARERGEVACIGPRDVLSALLPIWRKRLSDGNATLLWVLGEESPPSFPVPIAGSVPLDRVVGHFGSPAVLLTTEQAAGVATILDGQVSGLWSSESSIVGAASAAIEALTT